MVSSTATTISDMHQYPAGMSYELRLYRDLLHQFVTNLMHMKHYSSVIIYHGIMLNIIRVCPVIRITHDRKKKKNELLYCNKSYQFS